MRACVVCGGVGWGEGMIERQRGSGKCWYVFVFVFACVCVSLCLCVCIFGACVSIHVFVSMLLCLSARTQDEHLMNMSVSASFFTPSWISL